MWVKVVSLTEGELQGSLDNDPVKVRDISRGDGVGFTVDEIIDVDDEDS